MNRFILLLVFFILNSAFLLAQDKLPTKRNEKEKFKILDKQDSLKINKGRKNKQSKTKKNKKAKIIDYKIISRDHDTTYVDTTLTIYKDYKYNYLRKDDFDLLPFSNVGQTYNSLSLDFSKDINLMPKFGARARHFNYMEVEDINYYYVPTPFTELMFKTVFEQGQLLDAFFTVNTSKQLNLSLAYKGLRSLGKYLHTLTSTGNFRFTTNYKTKNNRYKMRGHIVFQDLLNEENGGLTDEDVLNFESGDEDFLDRSSFDPLFENAENILKGRRFHLDHHYNIVQQQDSLKHNILSIGNVLSFDERFYRYTQDLPQTTVFGNSFRSGKIQDRVDIEQFYVETNASYNNKTIGHLKAKVGYTNYNYGYNKLVQLNGKLITNRFKGEVISAGGLYRNTFGKFTLKGELGINVSGDFDGNFLKATAQYTHNKDTYTKASLYINNKTPNYNYLLYQHNYLNYNWQNNFNNTETRQLQFHFHSKKWFNIQADYTTIDNYTYFLDESLDDVKAIKPQQSSQTINYFRAKFTKEIKYKKFTLENTIRYQKVLDGEGAINVPEIVTRNTLYYSNHFFKKNLYLQTGVTFNYFTAYYMNAYDPVLSEFYVQNTTKYGGFPRFDFFVNAKVRQTRIFFKAEHFNAAFTGYDYYSAPNYPYRDFVIRFGLVWNFFL